MKWKLHSALLILLLTVGCRSIQHEIRPATPVVLTNTDSVRVERVIETVYVPVEVDVDLPQQSESKIVIGDSSHVETDLAESDVWINGDGSLVHLIRNKPGKLHGSVYVPQTTEKTDKDAVIIKEIPVPDPYPVEVERELTLMEQIKLAAFWYLLGIVALGVGYLFRGPLMSIIRKTIPKF